MRDASPGQQLPAARRRAACLPGRGVAEQVLRALRALLAGLGPPELLDELAGRCEPESDLV